MNIEYGREFIELARCLNFTEAARRLNLTQPALSKHIHSLEQEFGAQLIDRSKRGLKLTEGGRIFFESANAMVDEYEKARKLLRQLGAKHPIHVVANTEDSDVAAFSSMTATYARQSYHASIVFDRRNDDPFKLLASGSIDLFIGYTNPDLAKKAGFRVEPFIANELTVIVSTDNPLAENPSITWDDLRNQTFLRFVSDLTNSSWEQIERTCEKHGFKPITRPVLAENNVEFFSTPLLNSVLVWKKTQREIGWFVDTGRRASIPIIDDDNELIAYAVYRPESAERLSDFFSAAHEVRAMLSQRHDRKNE